MDNPIDINQKDPIDPLSELEQPQSNPSNSVNPQENQVKKPKKKTKKKQPQQENPDQNNNNNIQQNQAESSQMTNNPSVENPEPIKKKKKKEKQTQNVEPAEIEEIPEMEQEKFNTQFRPNVFGNQLIPLEHLEKNSGAFTVEDEEKNVKNLALLTSAVQPFDQVLEIDEEWNYDVLHAEIGQIVRAQYGEFYQK